MTISSASTSTTWINNTGTAGTLTWSLTPVGSNNLVVLGISIGTNVNVTGMSSTNATWTQLSAGIFDATVGDNFNMWWGVTSSTSTATVTYTLSGSLSTHQIQTTGKEFTSTFGASAKWALDGSVSTSDHTSATTSIAFPTLTPSLTGSAYFGATAVQGTGSAGSTSGYTYKVDGFSNVNCYDPSVSGAQSPTATQTSGAYIVGALLFNDTPPSSNIPNTLVYPNNLAAIQAGCW